MLSNYIETFALSLIQGIFEFLPVSSSAHLLVIAEMFNFKSSSLIIDISLHLASFLAIIFYFRKDLVNFFQNKNLALLIIFGSIPLILLGLLLHLSNFIYYLRNLEIVAWSTLIFGIILFIVDKFKVEKKFDTDLNIKNILIIGLFQILALIPGVSRSGIVITAGRFLNFDRYDSTKISFFLSIPALAGASIMGLKDIFSQSIDFNFLIIFSIICSFLISYLTIKYFLIFVKNFSLNIFVFYRVFLALVLLVIIYN